MRRHSASCRCENGRSGCSGSTWVSLRMRNSIGSSPELFGHFVDGDLQRHHARRLAGRAHGVAFGQIEHREPHGGHAVGAGVEQPRLADRRLGSAARQIAGPALVADGGDLAVAARADADALDRRRPVRGVVEHEGPRQRHFHRPPGCAGAERGEQRVGAQKQFAAEAAADEGRDQADVLLGDAERLAPCRAVPQSIIWFEVQTRELVAVPGRHRSMRLHHRVRLIGRGVGVRRTGPALLAKAAAKSPTRYRPVRRNSARGLVGVGLQRARSNAPLAACIVDAEQAARRRAPVRMFRRRRARWPDDNARYRGHRADWRC